MQNTRLTLKKSTAKKIESKSRNQIRAWAGLGSATSPFMPSKMRSGEMAGWMELKINRRFFQATTAVALSALKIKDKRVRAAIQQICQDIAAEESMGRTSGAIEAFTDLSEIFGSNKKAKIFLRTLRQAIKENYKAHPNLVPLEGQR